MSEPPRRYYRSASQLKTYADCSERYRLERIVRPRLPSRPASWLALGTAAHDTLYAWEQSGREIDPHKHFDELYDSAIEELKEQQPDLRYWMKPPRTKTVEKDIESRKALGVKQIENYIIDAEVGDWEPWMLPDGPPAVEVGFEVEFGPVLVVGYIDIIKYFPLSDEYVVSDYKTGNRENGFSQIGLYGYAVRKLFGLPIDKGEYFYLKDGVSVMTSVKRYDDKLLGDIYGALDRGIADSVFIPNPHDCGMCGVLDWCREKGTLTA